MSEKYTPGPWEIVGSHVFTRLGASNRDGVEAHPTDGWNVATINPWACHTASGEQQDLSPDEVMANTCLIAAAPELFEALEELLSEYCSAMKNEHDYPGRPWAPERDNDRAALRAIAALKRARGEA